MTKVKITIIKDNMVVPKLDLKKVNDIIIAQADGKEPRPTFYAILPAHIRYSDELTHLEKILYAEITALSNTKGYCYAGNEYFSKHYKNSIRTITRGIQNLTDRGFIFPIYEVVDGKTLRKISINPMRAGIDPDPERTQKKVLEHRKGKKAIDIPDIITTQKDEKGDRQKCLPNNTIHTNSILNTTNTPPGKTKLSTPPGLTLPLTLGKTTHERLASLYQFLWLHTMGSKVTLRLNGQAGSLFKKLLADYSEVMIGLMIVTHFEWRGMNGDLQSAYDMLKKQGFPLNWIPNNAPYYEHYIKEKLLVTDDITGYKVLDKALKKLEDKLSSKLIDE